MHIMHRVQRGKAAIALAIIDDRGILHFEQRNRFVVYRHAQRMGSGCLGMVPDSPAKEAGESAIARKKIGVSSRTRPKIRAAVRSKGGATF
jgi:hypothetical protein